MKKKFVLYYALLSDRKKLYFQARFENLDQVFPNLLNKYVKFILYLRRQSG